MGPILHAVHLFRSHALYIDRALLSPIKMHASPQLFARNSKPKPSSLVHAYATPNAAHAKIATVRLVAVYYSNV